MARGAQKRRFEEGEELAWLANAEQGARPRPRRDWRWASLHKLAGKKGRVRVSDALQGLATTKILLEPARADAVLLITRGVVSLREPDDLVPRAVKGPLEVPFGTVIRTGTVVFAPLTALQAAAVREGRLELPVIGEAGMPRRGPALPGGSSSPMERRVLAIGLTLLISVATMVAGTLATYLTPPPPPPPSRSLNQFHLELSGWPSEVEANLECFYVRSIERSWLRAAGSRCPSSYPDERPDEPAHQITLALEVVDEHPAVDGEHLFVAAEVRASVRSKGGAVASKSFLVAQTAATREEALARLGKTAKAPILPSIVSEILLSEAVSTLCEAESRQGVAPRPLCRRRGDVSEQLERQRRLEAGRRPELGELAASGEGHVSCLTGGADSELPLGLLPDGSAAVVQTTTRYTVLPLDGEGQEAHDLEGPARIDLVELEGGTRRTLAWAEAFESIGALTADGETLLALEAGEPRSALLAIKIASGERRVLREVSGLDRRRPLRPSPDSPTLAYLGDEVVHLLDLETGAQRDLGRAVTDVAWVELAFRGDESPRHYLAAVASRRSRLGTPRGFLTIYDPASGASVISSEERQPEPWLIAGQRRSRVLFLPPPVESGPRRSRSQPPCGVGFFHPIRSTAELRETDHCLGSLAVTTGGALLGTADVTAEAEGAAPTQELVLVAPASGELRPLTAGGVEVTHLTTGGAERVLFAARRRGPGGGRPSAVCSLEVPTER